MTLSNIERMQEFYAIYTAGMSWEEAKPLMEGFYDKGVQYIVSDDQVLGYNTLLGFAEQAITAGAVFEVERIEDRGDGVFASGWMKFPGAEAGNTYVSSISTLNKEGKFITIRNTDRQSAVAVNTVLDHIKA